MSESNPEFYHPDGRAKSYDERAAFRKSIEDKKREIDAAVAKANEANRGPRNVFAEHLAKMDKQGPPLNQRDAHEWKARRAVIARQSQARAEELEKKSRADEYASSPLVARVRESASALERNWSTILPHATEDQITELVALSRTDSMSGEELNRAYFSRLAVIEEANLNAERLIESAAAVTLAKANADHLRQQKNVAERVAAAHDAREKAGDQ